MHEIRRPRLIGFDLDGTIVNSQNAIPECNVRALRAVHDAGIKLAFLTGRRPRTAGKHLDTIALPGLVATNSGCLLWDYPGWESLGKQFFPGEIVPEVAGMLAPHSVLFYVDSEAHGFEFFYLEREEAPALKNYFDWYIEYWGLAARRVESLSDMEGYEITQIAMPNTRDIATPLCEAVKARYDGQVLAMAVRWPLLKDCVALELFHPAANKGAALELFAGRLGIDQTDVMAVGDDVNDLAMINWAGTGVAMPNASPELTGVADVHLDGDGVESLAEFLDGILALK